MVIHSAQKVELTDFCKNQLTMVGGAGAFKICAFVSLPLLPGPAPQPQPPPPTPPSRPSSVRGDWHGSEIGRAHV